VFVEGACVVAQWPVQVCRGLCAHVTMHGELALLLWGSGTEPPAEFRGRALFRGSGGFEKTVALLSWCEAYLELFCHQPLEGTS